MSISKVTTVVQAGGINGATTSSVDTTGCNLIVIFVGSFLGATAPTLSDSKGNTWTLAGTATGAAQTRVQAYYCLSPTVGSGHTFTVSQAGSYSTVSAFGFSGVNAYNAFTGSATDSGTTRQPGSQTPPEDNCLLVCGGYFNATGDTASIDSSFTEDGELAPTANNTGMIACYQIQTTATARNPTVTKTGSANNIGAVMMSFTAAASGSVVPIIMAHNRRRTS
jgi:hypothetical protein